MDSIFPGLIADRDPSQAGAVAGTFVGESPPRMVARVTTVAFQGIDVLDVDVQVQMSPGLPAFMIVGLPDKAVGESKERVRGALAAIGLALPPKHISVNLAPADVLKEGSHFDLPIALALLTAMGVMPADATEGYTALGELALDGAVNPVAGVLAAAMGAAGSGRGVICPAASGGEAQLIWYQRADDCRTPLINSADTKPVGTMIRL